MQNYTDQQLKALAYDTVVNINRLNSNLQAIETELARRAQEEQKRKVAQKTVEQQGEAKKNKKK